MNLILAFAASFGERGVLTQETVARMNGFGTYLFGGSQDLFFDQVALGRGCGTDAYRFIGHLHMQGSAVDF